MRQVNVQRERLIERLMTVPGLRLAYLFGSQARGTARPGSDADVAVLIESPIPPGDIRILQEALSNAAGCDVDLVDLETASPLLRFEVVKAGQRLFVRDDDERTAFEARVMLDFMDTRHLRSIQHHYLSERAKAGHVA
jgi:uncharacterized protein